MKVCLISDTHGNLHRIRQAINMLAGRTCQAIVHCGDVDTAEALKLLASTGLPIFLSQGNMDRHAGIETAARELGVTFGRQTVELAIGSGRHLVATHGHISGLVEELIAGGQFPYVCHGHSHVFRDETIRGVRVINPGAVHRSGEPGLAVLDTDSGLLERLLLTAGEAR